MTAPIPCFDYAHMPLQKKYDMMHSGPGGAAATPQADNLGKLAQRLTMSSDMVHSTVGAVGVSWQGQAATAFNGSMQQAGQWAQQGSQTSQTGGGQMHNYASSYEQTKAKIPPPIEVGQQSGRGMLLDGAMGVAKDVFGVQSDYAKRLAEYQAADRLANAALTAHENTTRQTLEAFPTVGSAPPITSGTGGAQPGDPGAGPHGASGPGGGAGPGAAGPAAGGASTGTGAGAGGSAGHASGAGAAGTAGGGAGGTSPSAMPPPSTATTPSSFTPLTPQPGAGGGPGGLGVGGLGGPTGGPGGAGMPASTPMPPMPPMSAGGTHYGGTGYHGSSGTPPGPRGGTPLPDRTGGAPNSPAGPGETGGGAARSMPGGGMPMGGMGGMGTGGKDREHRNNIYLPSDDPFHVDISDEVVPAVLTNEDTPQ